MVTTNIEILIEMSRQNTKAEKKPKDLVHYQKYEYASKMRGGDKNFLNHPK